MSKLGELKDHLAKFSPDTEQSQKPKKVKMPDPASEDLYDWIDKHLQKLAKDHPALNLPSDSHAARALGTQAEEKLLSGLKQAIDTYFTLNPTPLNYAEATVAVEQVVSNWLTDSADDINEYIGTLMGYGYLAGLEDSEVPDVTIMDLATVTRASLDPKRIGHSISTFSTNVVNNFRTIISDVYGINGTSNIEDAVLRMQQVVDADKWKLARIVRTETAQASGYGRFMGWDKDDEKYYYEYLWLNPADKRSKDISRVRVEGNPYTYDEIVFLWSHQKQLIGGKWQDDTYHQRCSVTRYPRNEEFRGNRFDSVRDQFEETHNLGLTYE